MALDLAHLQLRASTALIGIVFALCMIAYPLVIAGGVLLALLLLGNPKEIRNSLTQSRFWPGIPIVKRRGPVTGGVIILVWIAGATASGVPIDASLAAQSARQQEETHATATSLARVAALAAPGVTAAARTNVISTSTALAQKQATAQTLATSTAVGIEQARTTALAMSTAVSAATAQAQTIASAHATAQAVTVENARAAAEASATIVAENRLPPSAALRLWIPLKQVVGCSFAGTLHVTNTGRPIPRLIADLSAGLDHWKLVRIVSPRGMPIRQANGHFDFGMLPFGSTLSAISVLNPVDEGTHQFDASVLYAGATTKHGTRHVLARQSAMNVEIATAGSAGLDGNGNPRPTVCRSLPGAVLPTDKTVSAIIQMPSNQQVDLQLHATLVIRNTGPRIPSLVIDLAGGLDHWVLYGIQSKGGPVLALYTRTAYNLGALPVGATRKVFLTLTPKAQNVGDGQQHHFDVHVYTGIHNLGNPAYDLADITKVVNINPISVGRSPNGPGSPNQTSGGDSSSSSYSSSMENLLVEALALVQTDDASDPSSCQTSANSAQAWLAQGNALTAPASLSALHLRIINDLGTVYDIYENCVSGKGAYANIAIQGAENSLQQDEDNLVAASG